MISVAAIGSSHPRAPLNIGDDSESADSIAEALAHVDENSGGTVPPLVSIGMPVYNGERFLREAVQSLLAQSFSDFELIISDNASTDGTADLCKELVAGDPRIIYYRQARNIGGAANFNFLLAKARGKYFKWAACDDVCRPSLLQACVDVLEHEPGAILSFARVDKIGEGGEDLGSFTAGLGVRGESPPARFARQLRMPGWAVPTQVYAMMPTANLRRAGGLGGYPGSDLVLFAALSLEGEFVELPDVLAFRRIHAQNSDILYKSDVDLAIGWFGAGATGKSLPKLRRCREYLRAIGRAPVTPWQKAVSVVLLAGKLFIGPGAALGRRVMLREALACARRLVAGKKKTVADPSAPHT